MDVKRICQSPLKLRFPPVNSLALIAGLSSLAIASPAQALPNAPMAKCYAQSLTFGASERDRDRAAYLCEGATSVAPAQCYWQALGFGATAREQDRAARLCRGLDDGLETQPVSRSLTRSSSLASDPAQCYWEHLSFGLSQRQALRQCSAQPLLEIPQAAKDCVFDTQRQLRVSRGSALIACSNAAR